MVVNIKYPKQRNRRNKDKQSTKELTYGRTIILGARSIKPPRRRVIIHAKPRDLPNSYQLWYDQEEKDIAKAVHALKEYVP